MIRFAIFIGLIFVTTTGLSPAVACQCYAPDFPEAVQDATQIFRGQVTKMEKVGEDLRRVSFKTSRVWKGLPPAEVLAHHVLTTCETGFVAGEDYLVLVKGSEPVYVDICSSSKLISEAARELSYLEKKFPPKTSPTPAANRGSARKKPKRKP